MFAPSLAMFNAAVTPAAGSSGNYQLHSQVRDMLTTPEAANVQTLSFQHAQEALPLAEHSDLACGSGHGGA